MIAVLERRLVEQALLALDDKPLAGVAPARLADVAAFLEGPPAFDDARCAALLAGLVWARPPRLDSLRSDGLIPFAYAALKPLFTPDTELRAKSNSERQARHILSETSQLPIPSGLVARLRRGAIDDAVREALSRARASGIGSPFNQNQRNSAGVVRFAAGIKAGRLAAALLIPINGHALNQIIKRAYPEALSMEEANHVA
jgi:CRISPR-associated protein Csx17